MSAPHARGATESASGPTAVPDQNLPSPRSPATVRALLVACGHFFFHYRNSLFPAAFVAIALATRPLAPWGNERADLALDALGFVVALSGQTLRALVIGLAYIRRGGKHKRIYAETLVQDGFFAHSRNPLYLGNMLVLLGLFMILNSVAGYAAGVPFFFLAYLAITHAEEDFLRRRFGAAYDEYCRRVNRFIPSVRGLGATMRSMAFDWKRLLRKEYGSTFTWIFSAFALLLYESLVRRGWEASLPRARAVLAVWVLVLAGYGVVRYLKKTKRLA